MIKIAIDGPSGSGKSSVAKALSKNLGIVYVDTGALYRSIGYYVRTQNKDPKNAAEVEPLPKHVFYEDNLMVCRVLPHVKRMYYMDIDLYRYWIGRPDQSVQAKTMLKLYTHHLLVMEKCFTSFHFDDIEEPRLKRYLKHEIFMLSGIATLYTRMNKTREVDADLRATWQKCFAHDEKWGKHFRYWTPLTFVSFPGKLGQHLCSLVNWLANHVVKFN